jgi:hypothetical protein
MAIVTHFNRAPKQSHTLSHGGDAQAYEVIASTMVSVGRRRVQPGAVVWLTPLQAAYELNAGHIALMKPQPPAGTKRKADATPSASTPV